MQALARHPCAWRGRRKEGPPPPPYFYMDLPPNVPISVYVNGSLGGLCQSFDKNGKESQAKPVAVLQWCTPPGVNVTRAKGHRALDRARRPHLGRALQVCVGGQQDCLATLRQPFSAGGSLSACVAASPSLPVPSWPLPSLAQPVLLNCAWGLRNRWDSFPPWL